MELESSKEHYLPLIQRNDSYTSILSNHKLEAAAGTFKSYDDEPCNSSLVPRSGIPTKLLILLLLFLSVSQSIVIVYGFHNEQKCLSGSLGKQYFQHL
jgi:hypothetical protein